MGRQPEYLLENFTFKTLKNVCSYHFRVTETYKNVISEPATNSLAGPVGEELFASILRIDKSQTH
jgi:hypothetical protein